MQEIYALYDISGIQRFIFSSGKLKDILGASELIRKALTRENLGIPDEKVVYSGGGNAVLSFADHDEWKAFNHRFLRKCLTDVPGVNVLTVSTPNRGKLSDDISELFTKMAKFKNTPRDTPYFGTLPMMAQSGSDKTQVVAADYDKRGDLSFADLRKLRTGNALPNEAYKEFDGIAKPTGIEINVGTDEKPIIRKATERMLAVIHLDGNRMGQTFMQVCKEAANSADIKAFSTKLNDLFNNTFDAMVAKMREKGDGTFPCRKLYINGDDVNYVCNGAFGIASVVEFMKQLVEIRATDEFTDVNPLFSGITASAGIALVKPHYPFYEAYEIAESLCKSAKDGANVGDCRLNFELVRGSRGTGALKELFARPYCVGNGAGTSIENLSAELRKIWSGDIARGNYKKVRNASLTPNTTKNLRRSTKKQKGCSTRSYPILTSLWGEIICKALRCVHTLHYTLAKPVGAV
jgi:hypothetical protein